MDSQTRRPDGTVARKGGDGVMVRRALARMRRVPPVAFLLAMILLLSVVNLGHWRYYHLFREGKDQDLRQRLRVAAESLAAQVERERPWILDYVASQPDVEEQSRSILELARNPVLLQLETLTRSHEELFRLANTSILTTGGIALAGDEWRFFELDSAATSRALSGETGLTERYEIEGRPFQRVYAPIRATSGLGSNTQGPDDMVNRPIVGLAAVALSPDFLAQLQAIQQQAVRQSLISSGLLLLLAISLWRLLRHAQRLEARALQGARAEAMGVLAGGLAHELRNPLGIIRMLGEEVVAMEPADSQTVANVRDILDEVDRLGHLTSRFLSLARAPGSNQGHDAAGQTSVGSVDLGPELTAVTTLIAKGAPAHIRLVVEPHAPLTVLVEPEALRQVLLNLILNAQEALGAVPGEIVISVTQRRDRAEIRIADTGPGMDSKTLARVFDPFFSTKTTGSGLGLAISRTIVENAGGELTLNSQPGRGTTAVLGLPVAPNTSTGNPGTGW